MGAYSSDEVKSAVEKYSDMVYRLAVINVHSRDTADDIHQEVFLRFLKIKRKLDGGDEHIKAWLIRTTVCCCHDYHKTAWFRKISFFDNDETKYVDGSDVSFGHITECVSRLPEKYRTVIHLFYFEELGISEIASLLGRNRNTVASQLSRGRKILGEMLKEDSYEI